MIATLYFAKGSSSFAAQVSLEETNESYEGVPIVLGNGEQQKPDYLRINPRGRIPALVTDNGVITENIAILTYIAFRFPNAMLLPLSSPNDLAHAYELMSWFASSLHATIAQIWRTERYTCDELATASLKRDGPANLAKGYTDLESQIRGPWVLGENYSVLDPYAYVFWRFGERLSLPMDSYPRWSAHTERLLTRPAVARALAYESDGKAYIK